MRFLMTSDNFGQELNLLAQVLLQPWQYLEQVDVEVSSIGRHPVVFSDHALFTYVYDTPADDAHLKHEKHEEHPPDFAEDNEDLIRGQNTC